MLLTFLGTGAGDFYEVHQKNCKDEHCAKANQLGGKNIRRATSMMIDDNILIDYYSSDAAVACGTDISAVKHLLITHGHYDHFQPEAILQLTDEINFYGNQTVVQAMEFIIKNKYDDSEENFIARGKVSGIKFHEFLIGKTIEIGGAMVTAVHANHMIDKAHMILEQTALNFIIEKDGKTIFYGLDSSYFLPESMNILKKYRFDALVLDATFGYRPVDIKLSGHLNFEMVEKTVQELRNFELLAKECPIILSHISCHHVAPHDDIVDELTSKGFILAYDGMKIKI